MKAKRTTKNRTFGRYHGNPANKKKQVLLKQQEELKAKQTQQEEPVKEVTPEQGA